jgi:hypothetical protein
LRKESGVTGVAGVAGVQEFRSSGVQEFRSSGVQEFRSSGVIGAKKVGCKSQGSLLGMSPFCNS